MLTELGKLAKIYPGGEVPRWCEEVLTTLEVSPLPGEDDLDKPSLK